MTEVITHTLIDFVEVLPESGDIELTLLKSHLLIEEAITNLIVSYVESEQYLYDARLTFDQKCKLARSLVGIEDYPWLWKALKLLNQARNKLSHNLNMNEIESKLTEFVDFVASLEPELVLNKENEKYAGFHLAAYAIYNALASKTNFVPNKTKIDAL